jgi:hypothetical protein
MKKQIIDFRVKAEYWDKVLDNPKATILKNRVLVLLNDVLLSGYPELSNKELRMYIIKKGGFWMAISNIGYILVDYSTRKLTDRMIKGLLAHELSHLTVYSKYNRIIRSCITIAGWIFPSVVTKEERMVDMDLVERGFGQEYYEFLQYHDKYYEKINKTDGITKKELKEILKNKIQD